MLMLLGDPEMFKEVILEEVALASPAAALGRDKEFGTTAP
jgi:hypothetical protein